MEEACLCNKPTQQGSCRSSRFMVHPPPGFNIVTYAAWPTQFIAILMRILRSACSSLSMRKQCVSVRAKFISYNRVQGSG
jgi:hypothetical protein